MLLDVRVLFKFICRDLTQHATGRGDRVNGIVIRYFNANRFSNTTNRITTIP